LHPGFIVRLDERAPLMAPTARSPRARAAPEAAMRATDAVMTELNMLCRKRKLIAPTVANTTLQLIVVEGGKKEGA
jgi:hypothetical protein